MEFIQARWFTRVTAKRRIDFIVLHSMEAPEKGTTAESVARYFAAGTVKASAHFNVDADSIVQSVRENDIAYHAPPNTHSIGVEHAGYARQTRAQWLDAYGLAMLRRSAGLVRALAAKHDVPLVFLSPAQLRAGKRGITTHANVSKAWGLTSHTDPGKGFPIDHYMALLYPPRPEPPQPQEDDDMVMQRYTDGGPRGEFVIAPDGAVHLKNATHRDLLIAEGRASKSLKRITKQQLDELLEKE